MTLSPQQAADKAGVSRRTIMVAIENKALHSTRNNRNHHKIEESDLEKWMEARMKPTTDTPTDIPVAEVSPNTDLMVENSGLKAELQGVRELLKATQEERDQWRELANRSLWKRIFG